MTDYSKGLIYRLCCKDPKVEEVYIGSTVNFNRRRKTHKHGCMNEKNKGYNFKKYKFIRENGGWENWSIELLHNYPCANRAELSMEEERVRQLYNNINERRAYLTEEERKEDNRQWRINNKEKINEKTKCECGAIVVKRCINRHRKSKKHMSFLSLQNNI